MFLENEFGVPSRIAHSSTTALTITQTVLKNALQISHEGF